MRRMLGLSATDKNSSKRFHFEKAFSQHFSIFSYLKVNGPKILPEGDIKSTNI